MTSDIAEFRTSLVAAVQAELERHAAAVVAEVERLRDETKLERIALAEQIAALTESLDALATRHSEHEAAIEGAQAAASRLETRITDAEQRQTRRLDEVASGLGELIEESTKPMLGEVRDEQESLGRRIEAVDGNLRKFDEQAARMVTYFNELTQQIEQRHDDAAQRMQDETSSRIDDLQRVVDANDASVRSYRSEIAQSVTQKLNDVEDRLNTRVLAAENRVKDDCGQKIAELDLHLSRVSSSLDETLGVINDRIASFDDRFADTGRRIDEVEATLESVDESSIEALKEKMSAAAGEAMLVRIEMERLEKAVGERSDSISVRLTEVETQLQDQTMDVSTAIQLDRLEDLERAIAELDPSQFVRKDGADSTIASDSISPETGSGTEGNQNGFENAARPADATDGPDIAAIIAASEGRPTEHGQD